MSSPTAAPFSVAASLRFADEALSKPPTQPHIVRPEPRDNLVTRFVLPVSLCPTTNRTRHAQGWQLAKLKAAIWRLMQIQNGSKHETLNGRPQVLCVRFSSVEPDRFSDWGKMPVDLLCVPKGRRKHGLGLLVDDAPRFAEVHQWWEQAPKGQGFCYFEVRS
jgi:hypothetical protein